MSRHPGARELNRFRACGGAALSRWCAAWSRWCAAMAVALMFAAIVVVPAIAAGVPMVTKFSPRGTVKGIRQVTVRFSQPMVPLGDPRASVTPFDIDCAPQGSARWIDSFNWSYDFASDLPAGIRCVFTLHKGLKALSGQTVAGAPPFRFDTGGPAVIEERPWSDSDSIDEQQAFVLMLDTAPDLASIADHASFSVEGVAETIGATVMQGADREVLAKRFERAIDKRPFVILQARQSFPDGAAVTLTWGKGIRSQSGVATADDQQINYKVRKAFAVKIRCERENPQAGCIPLTPIQVHFTAEVARAIAQQVALIAPDGTRIAPVIDDSGGDIQDVKFAAPFAESATYKVVLPPNFTDETGRLPINASSFPNPVATGEFPPLAKFSARFGIIEAADPVLPITVRNLEAQIHGGELKLENPAIDASGIKGLVTRIYASLWRMPAPDAKSILDWLKRVAAAKRRKSVFGDAGTSGENSFEVPKPNGPNAFEVMGIPLKGRGLYIVELKSERLGKVLLGANQPMYVPTAALVTNLAVHFKQGKANSLVWVTQLDNASPVEGADVTIADCHGDEIWRGRTDSRGIALTPHLEALENPPRCDDSNDESATDDQSDQAALSDLSSGVMVTAQSGDDFSFVHSSWKNGLESWRFHLPTDYSSNPYLAHTVFDRTLLRAGETVHMKHFARTETLDGFGLLPAEKLPDTVSIRFGDTDQKYDFPLTWNADGTAVTDWNIPKEAKLGQYQVVLTRKAVSATPAPDGNTDTASVEVQSGTFEVEEFRVPLMKAAIKIPAEAQVGVTEIPLDISADYLSGGAAKGLPIVLQSQINATIFPSFQDFDGFTFANGAVKEGVRNSEDAAGGDNSGENPGVHQRTDLTLDDAGGARTSITDIALSKVPQEVRAEIEFRDPNGETQTVANTVTIWPGRLLPGIRIDDWTSEPGIIRAEIAVVDDNGRPAAHVPVQAITLSRNYYSYRKRLIGGFYAYENTEEVKRVGPLCSGVTNGRGIFFCEGKPGFSGEAIVQVAVTDKAGDTSVANTSAYVEGDTRMWFPGRDDDRMEVVAEQPEYQPGAIARFQVRMPFSEATALVTIEREGIIAASVVHLSGKNPVVTLPVRDYAPNVFVSVLAVRGRVAGIQPTAMVDLGKPTFKLGIAAIRVGWREHQMRVTVTPSSLVYHVREKARVKISARAPDGSAPPPDSSVTVAAVDEGLLELKPNESWKLLEAMMDQRPYQVETSTAEMQVVGRRHYGLKAIPPGGGGGKRVTRELFDTLLLWKATVPLDANGDAEVEVPLNDSLTSFRIVAIAAAGDGEFGTGAATIRSTQDLQLFSGVSPIARTGDTFAAEFTIRNASDHAFEANLSGTVDGLAAQPAPQQISLGPGDGKTVSWNIAVPQNVTALKYRVDAVVPHGPSDHLAITQQVIATVPVRTWQATLVQLDKPVSQPVAIPAEAIVGQGGIAVRLSPSLTAGLGGIEAWMRAYPYVCMEQRVSRAVALKDPALWKGIVGDLPSYTDADGMLKYFPSMQEGSDVLTSYVLAIANESGLTIPPDARASMESALTDFIGGKLTRDEPFAVADLPLRKLSAIEALSRYGKVTPSMLTSLRIEPNLWPDSAVIDWMSTLERTAAIPKHDDRLDEAQRILQARLNVQGTAMHLASDPRNDLWWLMVSPASNMVRLTLALTDANLWHDDVPKIMQGALALQQRGAWEGTITNAWGVLAIEKFAAAFEASRVAGVTTAALGATIDKLDWAHDPNGGSFDFAWPPAQSDLTTSHAGSGSPWAELRASAAIPLKAPFSSGYTIEKTLTPVDSAHQGGWKQGDLVRVHLKIDAQTDMTWVVVDDPIPAGASHLGIGLGRESQIATAGENENNQSWVWPSYTERAFSGFRAYYDYVPKGTFEVEYTIRLNQIGTFELPPTHVEALYEPEMLGELPNAPFTVTP